MILACLVWYASVTVRNDDLYNSRSPPIHDENANYVYCMDFVRIPTISDFVSWRLRSVLFQKTVEHSFQDDAHCSVLPIVK